MDARAADQLPVEVWNRICQLLTGKNPVHAPHEACAQLRLVNKTAARAGAVRLYYRNCNQVLLKLGNRVTQVNNGALKSTNLYLFHAEEVAQKIAALAFRYNHRMNRVDALDQALVKGARTDDPETCKRVLSEARAMYKSLEHLVPSAR